MTAEEEPRHAIAPDVALGSNVRLGPYVNLYGCAVGDDSVIGAFVEVQRGASIGARCKVSTHTFVCEGVTIEDEVFVGHGVTFINDRYPEATTADGQLQRSGDWEVVPTRVCKRASIGSGATVLCGVTIGEAAMVGAGALVTRDVPAGALVIGSPARVVRDTRVEPAPTAADAGAVPFLDLPRQHRPLRDEILAAWSGILDRAAFVSGSEVRAFEEEFARVSEVGHTVAVASGTSALELALRALGFAHGDKAVVPANTFIATAEAVSNVGGTPTFVDCSDDTANIDAAAVERALDDDAVRGVVGVHLYGQPFDVGPVRDAVRRRGLWLLEDAAQAHMARYDGRPVGGLGDAAAFSFYPGKNLGAPGEGGAVTTNDDGLADLLRMLRDHGQRKKYRSEVVGGNARMSELVAAVLRIKLRFLPEWTAARRRVATWYNERLDGHPDIRRPAEPTWAWSVYHLYVVHVPERDRVRVALDSARIGNGLHYPVPLHLQAAYAGLGLGEGSFPHTEDKAKTLLSLPLYPEMTEEQVERVCEVLVAAVEAGGRHA